MEEIRLGEGSVLLGLEPFISGIGKSEPLKHNLSGYWSLYREQFQMGKMVIAVPRILSR
ncbi:MAG: type II toxin-antitoxin system YoeB family toxin [Saprospiraceae bacterium]|nr:type II toxin-antitoxin system YoeB family toxin [Saprospiraceae bacterium]